METVKSHLSVETNDNLIKKRVNVHGCALAIDTSTPVIDVIL
jgi:hypothetical protein